jgi:ligand-binding sensor domain-containing protein
MKKIYLLFILATTLGTNAYSQSGLTTYSCSITGLNGGFFSSFVIDNNGVKWMGFKSGTVTPHPSAQLLRFDGVNWDTFPHVPARRINAMAVDAANNLWIGTDTGLVMFNGSVFTTYCMANSNITSNKVVSVACGGGKIYAGLMGG